jgi:hypothetical protein
MMCRLLSSAGMSLAATVANPLTDPVPPGWDEFVATQQLPPVWRSSLVRTADWCAQAASSMVVVYDAGSSGPVALFHARHVGPARVDRFVRPGRLPLAGLTECRINPNVCPGLAFSDALDDRDRTEACRVFERAVRRHTRGHRFAFAYRYVWDSQLAVIPPAGRLRLRLAPGMVLHNEWPDRASYAASLPRKWRSQLRKIHETISSDAGLRVEIVDTVEANEACWLADVVRRRHLPRAVPRPPWPARYFQQLAELPGTGFLTYRDARGRLIGCLLFHDDGRDLVLFWWGVRAGQGGQRRNLYFDSYFRMVQLMLDRGRQRMILGSGMEEIKARYGARPEARWGLVGLR